MLKKQGSKGKQQQNLKIFNNQYLVKKKISAGSFGVVFLGEDSKNNQQIAMKVERNQSGDMKSLDRESHILSRLQGIQGIPKMYWNGSENNYNILVMQLLGKDLAHYVKVLKKLNLKTVLMVGIQVIQILEQVHNRSVVHRDIKPENMLVGGTESTINQVYLVDFGISKFYKDTKGSHIPYKEGKPFIGTTRYASLGAHKGTELGRMDDLESLGYILVYMFKGVLPWQNLQNVSDKDKTKAVGELKKKIDLNELCKDMPIEFVRYFEYVKKLHFKAQPDYRYILSLFEKVAEQNQLIMDNQFEWIEFEQKNSNKQKLLAPKQQEDVCNTPKSNNNLSQRNLGQGSQFDFLKPPDKQRQSNKRKSIASLANSQYSNITYQSSVANNYQGSMLSCIEKGQEEDFDKLTVASDDESNLKPRYMKLQKTCVRAQNGMGNNIKFRQLKLSLSSKFTKQFE